MQTSNITDEQITEAATALARMVGQGGRVVYDRRDLSGGTWYSDDSRPALSEHEITVTVPRSGANTAHDVHLVERRIRHALAGPIRVERTDDAGRTAVVLAYPSANESWNVECALIDADGETPQGAWTADQPPTPGEAEEHAEDILRRA